MGIIVVWAILLISIGTSSVIFWYLDPGDFWQRLVTAFVTWVVFMTLTSTLLRLGRKEPEPVESKFDRQV